jgi:phospholipase/carboxylesterase
MKTHFDDNPAVASPQLDAVCRTLALSLDGLGMFQRRFFPPAVAELRQALVPLMTELERTRQAAIGMDVPEEHKDAAELIIGALDMTLQTFQAIMDAPESDFQQTVVRVMRSFRNICKVQEILYGIRWVSPALNRFFLEDRVPLPDKKFESVPESGFLVGLNHFGTEDEAYARGGVSIYVPEYYSDTVSWPVVIALHGGYGHGRDFIWTWLREARSRGFILLAPSSKGTTWSILDPETDGNALIKMIAFLKKHYRFDMDRILLTGISDGGTFSLQLCPAKDTPFTAFAPIAGVLAPMNINGTKDKRIYWAHGALDWMFPVKTAKEAATALKSAGADVTLRVIDDLSHTYPREENDKILQWFDTKLALPSELQ